jgi:hypothetical protein
MFGNDLTHFLWAETVWCRPLHRDKNEKKIGKKHKNMSSKYMKLCMSKHIKTRQRKQSIL